MTQEQLATILGITEDWASLWWPEILDAVNCYEIDSPARLAAFVSQTGYESDLFREIEENTDYSAAGLVATFPHHFTPESATQYARQPHLIANLVYANRDGNGPPESNDGWNFRGRGLIQITGRENYASVSAALDHNFILEPSDLAMPAWAALSAGWYWKSRGLNELADAGNFDKITLLINGGLNGQFARQAIYQKAKSILGVA